MTKEEFLSYVEHCSEEDFNYKQLLINLKSTDVEVDNDETFVLEYQNKVLSRNSRKPSMSFLNNYKVNFCSNSNNMYAGDNDVQDISNWTIRHYSEQPYDLIRSKMSLERNGISTKGNTEKKDWLVLGNTGNTFFVLCYKGNPLTKNGFLNSSTCYFEMGLASVQTKIWISEDLLPLNNQTPKIIGGDNGQSLFNQLFEIQGFKKLKDQLFIEQLKNYFNNSIEIKIPSAVPSILGAWH